MNFEINFLERKEKKVVFYWTHAKFTYYFMVNLYFYDLKSYSRTRICLSVQVYFYVFQDTQQILCIQ